jgi:hypothetical protein
MELGQFVTQDLAEEGVWTPVILYGKPADFDLLILGSDSDAVQQHSRQAMKKLKKVVKKSANDDKDEFDDEAVDELTESNDESVLIRIAGIRGWNVERKGSKEISRTTEPVTLGGVELKNDRKSYELLLKKIPAIKEFVSKVSETRTNFLSGKKSA